MDYLQARSYMTLTSHVNHCLRYPCSISLFFLLTTSLPTPRLLHSGAKIASDTTVPGDCGSDHTPVLTTVRIKSDKVIMCRRPKWKLDKENVPLWKESIQPQEAAPASIEKEADNFSELLTEPAAHIFGKTKGSQKAKYSKLWWTLKCAKGWHKEEEPRRWCGEDQLPLM